MFTSAPDGRRHYFADYEVYQDGRPVAWGQVTHSVRDSADFAVATVVTALREQAARAHDVGAGAIRLRCVDRL
jgi:hypothetical protein